MEELISHFRNGLESTNQGVKLQPLLIWKRYGEKTDDWVVTLELMKTARWHEREN